MKTFGILALSSYFILSSTFAAPLNKRDLVVVTLTSNVVETVDVTTTIYVGADETGAGDSTPTTTSVTTTTTSTPLTTTTSSSSAAAVPTTSSTSAYAAPTTSSTPVYVAPTTTPSTTSTPAATYTSPTTSSAPPAATSSIPVTGQSSGAIGACSTDGKCSSSGTPCCGDITHYDTDAAHKTPGACGWVNDGAVEDVIALPHVMMGEQSNGNPFCGKTVTVSLDGKTATAKVVDKCMGCEGQSIDLSDHLFGQLGNPAIGRTKAQWWFN